MLDPFGGSGTTPAVAKKLGREYLAFEMSKDYAVRATERLAKIQPGDPLDGVENPLTSVAPTAKGRRRENVNTARTSLPVLLALGMRRERRGIARLCVVERFNTRAKLTQHWPMT